MDVNPTQRQIANADRVSADLIIFLQNSAKDLGLDISQLYYEFPLYKDYDDSVIISKILVISPIHGVLIFGTTNARNEKFMLEELSSVEEDLGRVYDILFSRLIRNPNLKESRQKLKFPVNLLIYAPLLDYEIPTNDIILCINDRQIEEKLLKIENSSSPLDNFTYDELKATIEGSKGMIRTKTRNITDDKSKGAAVKGLEAQIASFDKTQKHGFIPALHGIERIRGLAGSGKTIVLAMKAALMHLREPEARILYTFWTKSLYQHVQQIITRFYRQIDDKDPDWTKLHIMHGWGGAKC